MPRAGRRCLPYLALLAAWAMALPRLGAASFWYDELLSVSLATGPDFLRRLLTQEPYPPLYYLILKAWLWLSAAGPYAPGVEPARGLEWLARYPSVVAALLAVAALAALARRLRLPAAGLTPLLLVFSPAWFWYAREARMYTFWMAGLLLALLGALTGRRGLWALAATATLLTHYFAVVPLAGAALVGLALTERPLSRRALTLWLAPFLPLLGWGLVAWPVVAGFRNSVPGAAPTLATFLNELGPDALLADQFLRPLNLNVMAGWGLGALAAGALGLGLLAGRAPRGAGLLAGTLGLGAAGLWTLWQVRPVHEVRYLVWALPLIWLGVAALLGLPARRWLGARPAALLVGGLVLALGVWGFNIERTLAAAERTVWYPDFRALALFLNQHARPGDQGLAAPGYGARLTEVYRTSVTFTPGPAVGTRLRAAEGAALLEAARPAEAGRWWLLLFQDEAVDPSRVLVGTLEAAGSAPVESLYSREARLFAYAAPPDRAPLTALQPARLLDVAFAGGLTLAGFSLRRADNVVTVYLFWRLTTAQTQYLTGAVHLTRAPDQPPVAQQDKLILNEYWPLPRLPLDETLPDRYALTLPDGLPPGRYTLSAVVYDAGSGQRWLTASGQDTVALETLTLP